VRSQSAGADPVPFLLSDRPCARKRPDRPKEVKDAPGWFLLKLGVGRLADGVAGPAQESSDRRAFGRQTAQSVGP
jgi:hypothetical protein